MASCFCVGKDAPLLQVVNRMHYILLIHYRKTNMAETKQHSLISTFEMVSSSDFREDFASLNDWQNYVEYNRDTLIDGGPVF